MQIPEFFRKELALIDPTYRIELEAEKGVYRIIKPVSVKFNDKRLNRFLHVHGDRTVDVFTDLNQAALDKLKYRKRLGENMKIVENPMNELKYWRDQEEEAKKKEKDLMIDMIAAGLMKMHKFQTTQTWVMPGEENGKRCKQSEVVGS